MRMLTTATAAIALVMTMGAAQPARAGDALTKAAIVKLAIIGAAIARNNRQSQKTSKNTHYALTGHGRPYTPTGKISGPAHHGAHKIVCDYHGHCYKVRHGW